jgi:hypothetical protein
LTLPRVTTPEWQVSTTRVGYFQETSGGLPQSFIYNDGTYTILDFPGAVDTVGFSINDHGQVAGYYQNGTNNSVTSQHAFVYSSGQYTTIDTTPTSLGNTAYSINDAGQVVGFDNNSITNLGLLATPTTGHDAIQNNTSLGQLVQAMASFSPTIPGSASSVLSQTHDDLLAHTDNLAPPLKG